MLGVAQMVSAMVKSFPLDQLLSVATFQALLVKASELAVVCARATELETDESWNVDAFDQFLYGFHYLGIQLVHSYLPSK